MPAVHGGPLPYSLQFIPVGFPQSLLAGQHTSHDGSPAAADAANYAPPRLECCRIFSARTPSVLGGLPGWGLLCRPFSSQVGRLPLQECLTQLLSQAAGHRFRAGFCLRFATPFSPPFTRAITHHWGTRNETCPLPPPVSTAQRAAIKLISPAEVSAGIKIAYRFITARKDSAFAYQYFSIKYS